MKIGSEVEKGDQQASQPREGLQSQLRSYWTQEEPCKMFSGNKSHFQINIFLQNISRHMVNSWETTFQPSEKCSKAKPP